MTTDLRISLPNDIERRQLFYWLKRISSYTAWSRIAAFYKTCADAMEKTVSTGESQTGEALERFLQQSIQTSFLVSFLKGYSHMEKGVTRLRRGDKRVFQFNANGEFAMADRPLDGWSTIRWKQDDGEIYFEPADIPFFDELEAARKDVRAVWTECSINILESRYTDDPAPLMFGPAKRGWLREMVFPEPLPFLPEVREKLLIDTGDIIPCSGIWEPVQAEKTQGLFGLFKRPVPVDGGRYPIVGCMNYLHGGSLAPKAGVKTPDDVLRQSVTWRCLWRDDRYQDGTIPDEEQDYVFQEPERDRSRRIEAIRKLDEEWPEDVLIAVNSGDPAIRAGRWTVKEVVQASDYFKQGELLPPYNGKPVTWIWVEK